MDPTTRLLLALALSASLGACSIWEGGGDEEAPESVFGMRPVYFEEAGGGVIASFPPRPTENNTGIVVFGDFLFVIDLGLGVHVFDNANPRNPRGLAFISVPGISTLTATQDRLYANNFGDLVTIDIEDLSDVRVVDRDEGLFAQPLDFPEGFQGFFECYDPSRGQLVRWEEARIERPECRTLFF